MKSETLAGMARDIERIRPGSLPHFFDPEAEPSNNIMLRAGCASVVIPGNIVAAILRDAMVNELVATNRQPHYFQQFIKVCGINYTQGDRTAQLFAAFAHAFGRH